MDNLTRLQTYLSQHFLNTTQLTHNLAISVEQCEQAMAAGLFPAPSYVATDGCLHSVVFGQFEVPGLTPNIYVHRDLQPWMQSALNLLLKYEISVAKALLEQEFKREFGQALQHLHTHCWPMPDAFQEDGSVHQSGLEVRCERAWEYFYNGTFGVCVTHPTSAPAIAEKEILQEKLMYLIEQQNEQHDEQHDPSTCSPEAVQAILSLIRDYEEICMPFSHLEYPLSSRKKLDDFAQQFDR